MQTGFVEQGYHIGQIDGYFGPLTGRALLAFQNEHDLETDAIAGPQTLTALETAKRPEALPRVRAIATQEHRIAALSQKAGRRGACQLPTNLRKALNQ